MCAAVLLTLDDSGQGQMKIKIAVVVLEVQKALGGISLLCVCSHRPSRLEGVLKVI